MTKIKTLLKRAEKEITDEQESIAIARVKWSLQNIKDARRTLAYAENVHKDLLNSDVEDIGDDPELDY